MRKNWSFLMRGREDGVGARSVTCDLPFLKDL